MILPRSTILFMLFGVAAGPASAMIIFCDDAGHRIITTENQRPADLSYRQAVATAAASVGRSIETGGDLIGQLGTRGPSSPALGGASPPSAGNASPPAARSSVQRDRVGQAITLSNRALLQLQAGKVPQAIEALEKAMELNPRDSRAVMLRGVAAAREGRHELALDYYNRALQFDPGSVDAHQSRGLSLMKLDRLPQAVEAFTKAVTLNPKFEEGYVRRGLVYGRIGEYHKAVADNTAAISINPNNPLSYNNRAAAYSALGQSDKAAADIEASRRVQAAAKKK